MQKKNNGKEIPNIVLAAVRINDDGSFTVPSQTRPDVTYDIRMLNDGRYLCTCPDFEYRKKGTCKHILDVQRRVKGETARVDNEIAQIVKQQAMLERMEGQYL